MSNSSFDKNGVDEFGRRWIQYNALVIAAFAIFLSGHSSIMPISINSLKNIQVFEL